jgi:hypothetical protein
MNRLHHIDARLQHDFLINIIRRKKRFSKWDKPQSTDIECIKEYYGYSDSKAKQIIGLLTSAQLQELKNKVNKGGRE